MKTMKGWVNTGHGRACVISQKHPCTCENRAGGRGGGKEQEIVVLLSHILLFVTPWTAA